MAVAAGTARADLVGKGPELSVAQGFHWVQLHTVYGAGRDTQARVGTPLLQDGVLSAAVHRSEGETDSDTSFQLGHSTHAWLDFSKGDLLSRADDTVALCLAQMASAVLRRGFIWITEFEKN